MSIKVSNEVWKGSRHRSGSLLVLLALADHADEEGKAWPGIRLLASKTRLSERHTRRCLSELIASGELQILPEPAPSGGKWYQIQLHELSPDNLSGETPTTEKVTPVPVKTDAADHPGSSTYITEPSTKSSKQPSSKMSVHHSHPQDLQKNKRVRSPDSIGLVSFPKNGF
jgi:Helix-turn-helix domain